MGNKKLVAVLNEKIEIGKIMNALAHMALGLGGSVENREELRLNNYKMLMVATMQIFQKEHL